jgi:hypothetical protein
VKLALVLGFAGCATVVALALALVRPEGALGSIEPERWDPHSPPGMVATELAADASADPRSLRVAEQPATADAAGVEPPRGRTTSPRAGAAALGGQRFVETSTVNVRVLLAESHAPARGAMVTIRSNVATTDAEGIARFALVPTGPASVHVLFEGFGEQVKHVQIHAGWMERVEVELERPHVLEVRAVDARGRPFEVAALGLGRTETSRIGLVVSGACGRVGHEFSAFDAPRHRARARDGADGLAWSVHFHGAAAGCAQVVLGSTILGVQAFERGAIVASVVVDEAVLRDLLVPIEIRVVDADRGFALAGARVLVLHGAGLPLALATDGSGRVRVETLLVGGARVVALSPGHAPGGVTIQRPLDGPVTLRLSVGRTITGVVLDPGGRPLADMRVSLGDASKLPGPDGQNHSPSTRTAKDGTFEIRDVAPIEHGVFATSLTRTAQLNAGSTADCRFGDVAGVVLRCEAPPGRPGRATSPAPPR